MFEPDALDMQGQPTSIGAPKWTPEMRQVGVYSAIGGPVTGLLPSKLTDKVPDHAVG